MNTPVRSGTPSPSGSLRAFFERDAITAVLRSDQQDSERPHNERVWDGQWRWDDGREPRVALFSSLFSEDHPHLDPLDRAYRAFGEAAGSGVRLVPQPGRSGEDQPLEFFNFPNQVDIVEQLTRNTMPPAASSDAPAGSEDADCRQELLALARSFAELGDRALAFEAKDWATSPACRAWLQAGAWLWISPACRVWLQAGAWPWMSPACRAWLQAGAWL